MGRRHCETEQTHSDRGQTETADPLCKSREQKCSGSESELDNRMRHGDNVVPGTNQHNVPFRKTAFGYNIGRSYKGAACILI
jgi:hypothetical protein